MFRKVALLFLAFLLQGSAGQEMAFELVRVIEVEGRQGVAVDDDRYYLSGSTALYAYDKNGNLLIENETPFAGLSKEANHIGDISVHDGELFAGIEHFLDGRGTNIKVAVYDSATLEYKRSIDWNPGSGQVEVSAVAVDPGNRAIWMTDWVDGSHLYRYDLDSETYQGKMKLNPAPPSQQGIAVHAGQLYITADDGDAEVDEPDRLWQVAADPAASTGHARVIKTFTEFKRAGEIEGLDFDEARNELVVLNNRGKRIELGMPRGLYPGYDREIHELYIYRLR
jgi:hypothetical protein